MMKFSIQLMMIGLFALSGSYALAQPAGVLWHGQSRQLRYSPEGTDFVIRNGEHRFNRALYGTNTAFRVEAGDLPEFALYLPGMGGNLKLGLINGNKSKWLINAQSIEARYRPGSMLYHIKDKMLGNGTLDIQVLAGAADENIILKVQADHINKNIQLCWVFGGVTGKKFPRDGDIGADPESVFYLHPEYCRNHHIEFSDDGFTLDAGLKNHNIISGLFPDGSRLHIADAAIQTSPLALSSAHADKAPVIVAISTIQTGKPQYGIIQNTKKLEGADPAKLFRQAEAKRSELAHRVIVKTPDPYINTIGGALSIAADAIWESPSYMHGAVAWRQRLPAWRGPYVADPLGWHDRAWSHFSSYALSQVTTPLTGPVVTDTALHLARQLEKMGTSMFSSGYISRNPGGNIRPHHYDMNLAYIDELLNHFKWTGNLDEVSQMWPVIERSLAWEKRNFDADGDGLYDAYCAIWASDALQYSGGGVTHSSAYNYRANKTAAYLAHLLNKDARPYQQEAGKIWKAMHSKLWLQSTGSYAEYKDLSGLQLLHPSAGLWTVYHAIDEGASDAFQTSQLLSYVDHQLPHIPVIAKGLQGNYYLLSTTNWEPYDWSLNNVVMAENLHTALAYWQGSRSNDAFTLWKSALLESMYLGASPGNFQQLSFYDANRGELYRDFGDPIGMAARSLVEGLFGINPDLLKDTLVVRPGLPSSWNYASLKIPDVQFDFKRSGLTDSYQIKTSFSKTHNLQFDVPARMDQVAMVTINNRPAKWIAVTDAVGKPILKISGVKADYYRIIIGWKGVHFRTQSGVKNVINGGNLQYQTKAKVLKVNDPQSALSNLKIKPNQVIATVKATSGDHLFFTKLKQGQFIWWQPVNFKVVKPLKVSASILQTEDQLTFQIRNYGTQNQVNITINPELENPYKSSIAIKTNSVNHLTIPKQYLVPGSNHIHLQAGNYSMDTLLINWHVRPDQSLKVEPVDLSKHYNDQLTNIFKNKYLSPRPASTTLQLPWQGIGNWAYPLVTANIDDSGLKQKANNGLFNAWQGITFATTATDHKNILFTSQWDNYPHSATVPLAGKANHAYFLMAGSTNPMQSRMVNGVLTVTYTDGSTSVLQLKNPENWWPIEQDDIEDGFAFNTDAPRPLRVILKTGEVTDNYQHYTSIKGFSNKAIDGGAATILDLPLDAHKQLKSLQLSTRTNDVIIGLMAVTLLRN